MFDVCTVRKGKGRFNLMNNYEVNKMPNIRDIIVKCGYTGEVFTGYALPFFFRWECPCGYRYEKTPSELELWAYSDEIVVRDCPQQRTVRAADWPHCLFPRYSLRGLVYRFGVWLQKVTEEREQ